MKKAELIFERIKTHRRELHQYAEVGFSLNKTKEYIGAILDSLNISHEECGGGIVCEIGYGDEAVVLRADMDALQISEESGEPFSSCNGCCHACGLIYIQLCLSAR